MEYAKDEIFKIRYNTNLDRLEVGHERLGKRVLKTIKRHKFFTIVVTMFLIFSIINIIMICNFINLLENL